TEAGAEVINAQPTHEDGADRRIPLTLVLNPDEELGVMREEIFGPILPIRTYGKLDEAIDYVNANDRPLGLYFFGPDAGERRRTLDETISGGVTLDDVIFHISVEDLPFGGTGNSGIGNYHGVEGFRTFSHAKSVYKQTKLNFAKLIGLIPPYGKRIRTMMQMDLKK
ncbi:MAG: aldehyde dehydrogenase family protein, partial [Pseudomonadota bacterium]